MEIRDFETLIAITETGSLEAAGRRLGISAAAVSQRLARMEDLAGRQFVVRSQPARLTDAGDAMVRAGRQIRLVLDAARPEPDHGAAPLRVAIHHDSLAAWFIPAIAGFHQRTGRTLEVIAADHTKTRGLMRAGHAAVAVASDPDPLPGCDAVRLGTLDYIAVASRDHETDWRDLPVLCFDRQDSPTLASLAPLGLTDAPRSYIPGVHELREAVRCGAGCAVLPLPLVRDDIASGRLVPLLPERSLRIDLFLHRWRIGVHSLQVIQEELVAAFQRHGGT